MYHVSERPDGVRWDGMENWDPVRMNGVVFAFTGSIENQPGHRFVLAGLNAGKRYRLHYVDGSSVDSKVPGRDLMVAGLPVHLGQPLSSEPVLLEGDDAQHEQYVARLQLVDAAPPWQIPHLPAGRELGQIHSSAESGGNDFRFMPNL
jgi:hypothetical protein